LFYFCATNPRLASTNLHLLKWVIWPSPNRLTLFYPALYRASIIEYQASSIAFGKLHHQHSRLARLYSPGHTPAGPPPLLRLYLLHNPPNPGQGRHRRPRRLPATLTIQMARNKKRRPLLRLAMGNHKRKTNTHLYAPPNYAIHTEPCTLIYSSTTSTAILSTTKSPTSVSPPAHRTIGTANVARTWAPPNTKASLGNPAKANGR